MSRLIVNAPSVRLNVRVLSGDVIGGLLECSSRASHWIGWGQGPKSLYVEALALCAGMGVPDQSKIERMTAAIAHRGLDGVGFLQRDNIALGHRRLAIIDPRGGHQPMSNGDETIWITYNGEMYNYLELGQNPQVSFNERALVLSGRDFNKGI